MGRHSGSHTNVRYGTEGSPDEGRSGAYAAVPHQATYGQPGPDGAFADWSGAGADMADTSFGGTGYLEPDTGHHAYPAQPGLVEQAGYGGYPAEQHAPGYGYDGRTQGWEHPAPPRSADTWSAPGTMAGAPAHWDDPLEPYGSSDTSGAHATGGHPANGYSTDAYGTDTYTGQTYAPDAYATGTFAGSDAHPGGDYPTDAYAGDGYASGTYAIAEAPIAPTYDTTTFEPQSFVGYGYDASGSYPVVAPFEDPLADALYDLPTEHVSADGPGAGQYTMESEPWAASTPELESTSFTAESPDVVDVEPEVGFDPEPKPESSEASHSFQPRYKADPAVIGGGTSGRASTRRANRPAPRKGRRTLVAASGAVVTGAVLAGAVVLNMPDDGGPSAQAIGDDQAAAGDTPQRTEPPATSRDGRGAPVTQVSPGGASSVPMPTPSSPTTTDQLTVRFPLDPKLALSGKFQTVPGKEAAPGSGKKYLYAVEIEDGLQLDGEMFASTVQKTLNDPRSWAHDKLTFERTDAGKADFVVRLSSPETVHKICTPITGDTSESNVSCDAAGTKWVMINAWRWAQGSTAYGDDMLGYRQMLINHEVGHRIGHGHQLDCGPGGIAPVMMQQTKSREVETGPHKGTVCEANPWPYPAVKPNA
jgi:uncharacterized protein DUF3152